MTTTTEANDYEPIGYIDKEEARSRMYLYGDACTYMEQVRKAQQAIDAALNDLGYANAVFDAGVDMETLKITVGDAIGKISGTGSKIICHFGDSIK